MDLLALVYQCSIQITSDFHLKIQKLVKERRLLIFL